jgi:hypothetical protein
VRWHRQWLVLLGAVILGSSVVTGSTPVAARTSVGIFQTSVAIETLRGEGSAVNEVLVEAPQPGELVVLFDDVIPSESLSWERVDLGSTPYTLDGRITTEPSVIRYEGSDVGTRKVFEVRLIVNDLDDQPRAGFITYTFVPDSRPSGEGIGVSQGVAARVRVGAWPADLATIPAEIAVTDLRLARDPAAGTGLLDRVLPDIPRVLSRRPGIMSARTTNVGEVLVRADATLVLERLAWTAALPFTRPSGTVMVRSVDRPRLLVPEERWTTRAPTTVTLGTGEEVDRLPFLGFVRVTVESSARMGATTSDATMSATYLVAPWKELLLAIAAFLLYRWVRHRRRRQRSDEADIRDHAGMHDDVVAPSG